MKIGHVAWMVCCLGLASVFLVNCGNSSPSSSNGATATPTPSSSAGNQLYAFVLTNNGSGGITMVGLSGPYSNTSSSNYSFSLPALSAGVSYTVDGFFDTASTLTIPSSAQIITPPANDYGQQSNNQCISTNTGLAFYTATHTGINISMSVANGACTFGPGQSVQYSPVTGSAVVLSGTIGQTGL
jgi:hypothetical protein